MNITIYNKTVNIIKFGEGQYAVVLPASLQDGERGPAVLIEHPMKKASISQNWKHVLELQQLGRIDIE